MMKEYVEILIFYSETVEGVSLMLYAVKGDRDNVYVRITPKGGEFKVDKENWEKLNEAVFQAGIYLGLTADEMVLMQKEDLAEIEGEGEGN